MAEEIGLETPLRFKGEDFNKDLLRHYMAMQEILIRRVCEAPAGSDLKFKHVFDSTIGESDAERDYRRSTDTLAAIKRADEKERQSEPLTKQERSRILHRRMLSRHANRIHELEERVKELEHPSAQAPSKVPEN